MVPTNRSADGVRPRRPDRGLDDPDALGGEDGVEGRGELGVSVTDEELDRRSPARRVPCERLRACWVTQSATGLAVTPAIRTRRRVVVDEEEHVEPAEQHGVDAEEVAGDQALRLGGEELRPGRP